MSTSLIFLAGGRGERMGGPLPKQFLPLGEKPLAYHSLELLLALKIFEEVVVVSPPAYHSLFAHLPVRFALPGVRRQDSVYSGFLQTSPEAHWICVHDGVRPFITAEKVLELVQEGKKTGAATLAVPTKATIKESTSCGHVNQTLEREKLWEIQTPQLLKRELLEAGFAHAHTHQVTVTDDVSLAELLGHPVKLVKGCYTNLKITTPEDLVFAQWLCATGSASATMAPPLVGGKCSPEPLPSKA